MKLVNVVKRMREQKNLEKIIREYAPVLLTEQGAKFIEEMIENGAISKQEKIFLNIKVKAKQLCLMIEKELEDLGHDFVTSVSFLDKEVKPEGSFGQYVHISGPHLPDEYIELLEEIALYPFSGPCGRAVLNKKVASLYDIDEDPLEEPLRQVLKKFGVNTIHSLPLRIENEIVGTFILFTKTKQTIDEAYEVIRYVQNRIHDLESVFASLQERWRNRNVEGWNMIVSKNGVIHYVEEEMRDMLGYDPNEVIGKHIVLDYVHPSEKKACLKILEEVQNGLTIRRIVLSCQRKDGHFMPVEVLIIPVRSGRDLRYIELVISTGTELCGEYMVCTEQQYQA